jgi:hypothetical protein
LAKKRYRTTADKYSNEKGRSVVENRLEIHVHCDSHSTRLMLPVIGKYLLDLLMGLLDTNFVVTVLALPKEEDELTHAHGTQSQWTQE